ncbi:hypothetical protein FACS1894205_7410 [Alphaproteobacteria bacterium]|nr:hypothetical protein FACS1894205_7410 [Alphaproteobacteria bacterium]
MRVQKNAIFAIKFILLIGIGIIVLLFVINVLDIQSRRFIFYLFFPLLVLIGTAWFLRTTSILTISISEGSLVLSSGKDSSVTIPFEEIEHYNIYPLVLKKMGYSLRIRSHNRSYHYAITHFCNAEREKAGENYYSYVEMNAIMKKLKDTFDNRLKIHRKYVMADWLTLVVCFAPFTALIGAILVLLGLFYWRWSFLYW